MSDQSAQQSLEAEKKEILPRDARTVTMVTLRAKVEAAVRTIYELRKEKESVWLQCESALSAMRGENAKLRERYTSLNTSGACNEAAAAAATTAGGASVEEKMAVLSNEMEELKLAHERLQRQNDSTEEIHAKQLRKAADDAMVIKKLRTQVSELLEYRADVDSRLTSEECRTLKLSRESHMNAAISAGTKSRITFLDGERARLTAEVLEARSQLQVVAATHASTVKTLNASMAALRKQLAGKLRLVDVNEKNVEVLQRKLVSLQEMHEKQREDAVAECKKLVDLVSMHREEARDANAEVVRYKELIDTVTSSKLELSHARGSQKSLDVHAEALLKDLQCTIEAKIGQLEEQREALDRTQRENSRIQMDHENLMRELTEAQRLAHNNGERNKALEKENEVLSRKVKTLQDRILLAGTPQPPRHQSPMTEYFGSRSRRLSFTASGFGTPRSMDDGDDGDDGVQEQDFNAMMQQLRSVQQRHDSVMAALAASRDER